MTNTEQSPSAAEALAAIAASRKAIGEHTRIPSWYAPVYGLGMATVVYAALAREPIFTPLGLIPILLIHRRWQDKAGVRINGFRKGSTRKVTYGLLAMVLAILVVGFAFRVSHGPAWQAMSLAVLAGVCGAVASHIWHKIWRAELLAGRQP